MRETVELPRIDLSGPDLVPGTQSWDGVRRDVFRALEEYGCFEAVRENLVPSELHRQLFMKDDGLIEELFRLPLETKQRFVDSRKPFDGYLGGRLGLPLYEAMGISGVLDSSSSPIENLTGLLWPEGNTTFCDSLITYAKKLSELDLMVKRMVFEELGVEKYFDSHVDSTVYSVRINKYAAPDTVEDQTGSGAHTDKNFLTILRQNHVDGLQVQTKNGVWIKVSLTSPSSSIVMAGDSFLGWTNGRIHCSRHQVMMSGSEARYSLGLFSALEGTVQCPEELVDDQHPLLFKPFDEIGLLRFHQTEEGRRTESTLKAYCGVAM